MSDNRFDTAEYEREQTVPQRAQALLARLAAAETDAPALSAAQQRALYRCALQKAGLDAAAAQTVLLVTEEMPTAPAKNADAAIPAAPHKGRLIRWQRWALGSAAALLVIFGGVTLTTGGLAGTDLAAQEPEVAYSVTADAAPQEKSIGFAEGSAADAPAEYKAEMPSFYGQSIDQATAEDAENNAMCDEAVNDINNSAGENDAAAEMPDPTEDAAEERLDDAGAEALPALTDEMLRSMQVIMVEKRLYYGMGSVLAAPPLDSDYIGIITTTVPGGTLPTRNMQANFACVQAECARYGSGMALLLDGEWVYFAPAG